MVVIKLVHVHASKITLERRRSCWSNHQCNESSSVHEKGLNSSHTIMSKWWHPDCEGI